jgi:hypothetical protein
MSKASEFDNHGDPVLVSRGWSSLETDERGNVGGFKLLSSNRSENVTVDTRACTHNIEL